MKIHWRTISILLVTVVLVACQTATPTREPPAAPPVTDLAFTPLPTQQEQAYPAPESAPTSQDPYPAPDQPPVSSGPLYPDTEDGEEVSWEMAQAMILNGEVKQVIQAHSLQVTLMLKDGRTLITTEPAIDDVFEVIERCGDPCQDIVIATE